MRIGYACLTVGVPDTSIRSIMMKNVTELRLSEIISSNLKALDHILDYNIRQDIRLFRISSDLIPFGSSSVNSLCWWERFDQQFQLLGMKLKEQGIRVSMHPGQYTVLNSPEERVVDNAIMDLNYHTRVLNCLRTGPESKIILHIGGIYQDKNKAIERFCANYLKLSKEVRQRLVIENDDKSYHIADVLEIGHELGIPVVFDNLHHEVNPPDMTKTDKFWINECSKTWQKKDGPQKIHYSQQDPEKKAGSHSVGIEVDRFLDFVQSLGRTDIDIMLEVKDKNLSAVKCIDYLKTMSLL